MTAGKKKVKWIGWSWAPRCYLVLLSTDDTTPLKLQLLRLLYFFVCMCPLIRADHSRLQHVRQHSGRALHQTVPAEEEDLATQLQGALVHSDPGQSGLLWLRRWQNGLCHASSCAQSVHARVSRSSLTVPLSDKQKRKGLRGSVDLEKIKCVETVQPEPNAPQERMFAFQVKILGGLHFCTTRYLVLMHHCRNFTLPFSMSENMQ